MNVILFQTRQFYDIFDDTFTDKCESDENETQTLQSYWNHLIENRQERVEYFNKCVGVSPKAGPYETECFTLNTKRLVLKRNSHYGYVECGKHHWPVYMAGDYINGAVGVGVKGQSGNLTFCVSVTYEATFRTMSRSLDGERVEANEVLFSKSYTTAPMEINCADFLPFENEDVENDCEKCIVFPFDIALIPHVASSIQPFGDPVKICQIHAIYTRVRIYSEEGILKSVKNNSAGLWVEPKMHRGPERSLQSDGIIIRRDFYTGLFGTAGKISCAYTLSRNYFSSEEILELTFDVNNESAHDIDRVEGNVSLEGKWSDSCFVYTTNTVKGPGISARHHQTIDLQISTSFSSAGLSNCLLPISGGQNEWVQFAYNLNVTLVRAGFRKNIVTHVPLYKASKSQFF